MIATAREKTAGEDKSFATLVSGFFLSPQFKESFKTALAIVIAYGIALWMDWANPYWAGYAVAFCSLATIGLSLNKAAMRMFGTFVAVVVALTLIALFPQQRWPFMIVLSSYVAICTYLWTGAKHQYFWKVCGFVCVLICMKAGPDPVNAFQTAVLRTKETVLGILVYSLVALLLWPVSSRKDFFATASRLVTEQRQFCQAIAALLKGGGPGPVAAAKGRLLQTQTGFQQLLAAAESDTYEVWELRRHWRLYQKQATSLTEAIGHCGQSISELQSLKITPQFSNREEFFTEIEDRFAKIEALMAGQGPELQPRRLEPLLELSALKALTHFERAAVVVFRARLQNLEQLTRAQFETVRVLGGTAQTVELPEPVKAGRPMVPDPDRLLASVRVMLIMWLAYLALIYVDSVPGGNSFVTMAGVFGMIIVSLPQISVMKLLVPLILSVIFAGLVYMLILPQLSTFLALGLLLFSVTFAFCYLFSSPKQQLAKLIGIAIFLSLASISNQQSYSFMVVATNLLMFPLLFLLFALTASFPVNLRPEKSFLRLLGRYFRSCDALLASMQQSPQQNENRFACWKKAFHLQEIASIPAKLEVWAKFLDLQALPGTNAENLQALVPGLQELTDRIRELHDERQTLQDQSLHTELAEDARQWRQALQLALHGLGRTPEEIDRAQLQTRLNRLMSGLEKRIRTILETVSKEQLALAEQENFYRLLGAYRGVSAALLGYLETASRIDWPRWREERF